MAEKMKLNLTICTGNAGGPKKHACPDCNYCQFCPDDRCHVCLRGQKKGGPGKPPKKASSANTEPSGPCCRKITVKK